MNIGNFYLQTYDKFEFAGLIEITPKIFHDNRGHFLETYSRDSFLTHELPEFNSQDNQSFSYQGTLRGLHFQKYPYEQGKLVRCVSGRVYDVAVDLRENSQTFKKWKSLELSGKKQNMLYIPDGCAHGFIALEDSIVAYKCTQPYNQSAESGIIWNDPVINIAWPIEPKIISEKDQRWPRLNELIPLIQI